MAQDPDPQSAASRTEPPRVLLIATTLWPAPARLARALVDVGFAVDTVHQRGNALDKVGYLDRRRRSGRLRFRSRIVRALTGGTYDVIVPCDDRSVRYLHRIHREQGPTKPGLARIIERSLGDPAQFAAAASKNRLMALAVRLGLPVPETAVFDDPAAFTAHLGRVRYPCVVKVDGRWGGLGVAIVDSAEAARRAHRRLTSTAGLLHHAVIEVEPDLLLAPSRGRSPSVATQAFVRGRPANRLVMCRSGRVLAGFSVEAVRTSGATGPASVIRLIDHPTMTATTAAVVGALGLSGFCGVDFMLDDATGEALLLEINPRATPTSHLALTDGTDLAGALFRDVTGRAPSARAAARGDLIALFPQEWRRDPASPFLDTAFHDVPWRDPALLQAMLAPISPPRPSTVAGRLLRRAGIFLSLL